QKKSVISAKSSISLQRERISLTPITACIRAACLPASLALFALPGVTFAGPEGGQVSAGQGNISKPDTNTTVINQQSHNLSINWNSFNVKQQELVQFNQPSKAATALNRI